MKDRLRAHHVILESTVVNMIQSVLNVVREIILSAAQAFALSARPEHRPAKVQASAGLV